MTIEVITVDPADPRRPFEPPNLLALSGLQVRARLALSGLQVRARLEPGDQIAAIVKDHDGRVIGYIAQDEADRVRAMPSAEQVRGYVVQIERMMDTGRRNMAALQAGLEEGKQ